MAKSLKPRYISGQEFHRFCQAKGVNSHCPRCGNGGWDLHDTQTHLGMAGMLNGLDGFASEQQTALLTLSCQNCGNLWAVIRGLVQDWLDENPGDEGDG